MKKQFYRVKQLADQRVGRAEKTELLNEDLQNAEKKVEKIRQVCQITTKKLNLCMQGNGSDVEKRLKKLPQLALSQSMYELALVMGEDSVLGNMVKICGDSQAEIAKDIAEYEMDVERDVISPFHSIIENDIPSINQNKKRLAKIGLDMDTLRSRSYAASKAKESSNSKELPAAEAKAEQLKTQYEEELTKFEASKDSFITEMLTLVSKELDYADNIRKFITAQLDFHRRAVQTLEGIMPLVDEQMGSSKSHTNAFGCSLEQYLKRTGRDIALVIEECIKFLFKYAMDVEGLFRLAGPATKVKKLKASFDAGLADLAEYEYDVHAVTGAFKQYLRELPEPLLTFELHYDWIEAGSIKDRDDRLQKLWTVVSQLPKINKDNLRYLIKFLAKIDQNSEVNKMSAHNLAIVMAPNLIWSIDTESGHMNVKNTGVLTVIVEALVEHANWFFPEDINFSEPTQTTNGIAEHSSTDGKQVLRGKSPVRKQMSSEESTNVVTLLDEAATLIDIEPVNDLETERTHSETGTEAPLSDLNLMEEEGTFL